MRLASWLVLPPHAAHPSWRLHPALRSLRQLCRNAAKISWKTAGAADSVRTREYLTRAEIERLMAAARKSSRYGDWDATMILIGYRHGLRASELCDLQWSQVELATGRLHVRRAKNGSPSVHQ